MSGQDYVRGPDGLLAALTLPLVGGPYDGTLVTHAAPLSLATTMGGERYALAVPEGDGSEHYTWVEPA